MLVNTKRSFTLSNCCGCHVTCQDKVISETLAMEEVHLNLTCKEYKSIWAKSTNNK